MMEVLVSCLKGIEDVCIKEIRELTKKKAVKVCDGRVKVGCDESSLKKLSENLRSGLRVAKLLGEFKLKSIVDMADKASKFSKEFIAPISVRCSRQGNHDFKSNDIEKAVGEVLHNAGLKVDLENPKTKILIDIVNDEFFICILIAENLNKREYRIRSTGQSINATICYALVRLSGWKKEKVIMDPFSRDGTIAIEAAAFKFSLPLKFDKPISAKDQVIHCFDPLLKNVNNSETNSKLAGVNKAIRFSRYDIEWLDTRFGKGEVDYIVAVLPNYSGDRQKDAEKQYKDLFYQAEFILAKNGQMALLSQTDIMGFIGKFKIESERKVISGDVSYNLLILKK